MLSYSSRLRTAVGWSGPRSVSPTKIVTAVGAPSMARGPPGTSRTYTPGDSGVVMESSISGCGHSRRCTRRRMLRYASGSSFALRTRVDDGPVGEDNARHAFGLDQMVERFLHVIEGSAMTLWGHPPAANADCGVGGAWMLVHVTSDDVRDQDRALATGGHRQDLVESPFAVSSADSVPTPGRSNNGNSIAPKEYG